MRNLSQFLFVNLITTPVITSALFSATTPAKTIVCPWLIRGISPELSASLKKELAAAQSVIDQKILGSPRPIANSESPSPASPYLSLNQMHFLANFHEGDASTQPLFIQPIWCALGSGNLIALIASDPQTFEYLGSSEIRLRDGELKSKIVSAATEIATALFSTIRQDRDKIALTIELSSPREFSRRQDGSTACLNLALAKTLAIKSRVITPMGRENWRALYRPAGAMPPSKHAVRMVTVGWTEPTASLDYLLTANASLNFTDAVLGQPLPNSTLNQSFVFEFNRDSQSVVAALGPELTNELDIATKPLTPGYSPMVSRVDRGWVYLDRGRGYGLTMDSRMIASSDGTVKGHVVGFFGPELGLKSPRGYVITEGAIVFIRTGQRKTKIGEEFSFDPRAYPFPGASDVAH